MATLLNICKKIRKDVELIENEYHRAVATDLTSGEIGMFFASKVTEVLEKIQWALGEISVAQDMLEKDSAKRSDYVTMEEELNAMRDKLQNLEIDGEQFLATRDKR